MISFLIMLCSKINTDYSASFKHYVRIILQKYMIYCFLVKLIGCSVKFSIFNGLNTELNYIQRKY